MAEVLGLVLCALGFAYGAFQVAVWLGLVVLGASIVAAVQVIERGTPAAAAAAVPGGDS